MGAKEALNPSPLQGVDNEHMGGGRVDLHRDPFRPSIELGQGPSQIEGIASELGAPLIGMVLPGSGDGQLDEERRNGGKGGKNQHGDELSYAPPFSVIAAEHGSPTGHGSDKADGPGDGGSAGPDEAVPV